jgi:hypothetical protein
VVACSPPIALLQLQLRVAHPPAFGRVGAVVIAVVFVVSVASEFAFQLFAVILSAAKDLLQTQWNLPSLLISPPPSPLPLNSLLSFSLSSRAKRGCGFTFQVQQ